MKLFSCFFGKNAPRRNQAGCHLQSETDSSPVRLSAGDIPDGNAAPRRSAEATTPGTNNSSTNPIMSNNFHLTVKPVDAAHGSLTPNVMTSSLATQLLDGLAFSTGVLGVGSYGIVLQGSFKGVDAAVKFMVSSRRTDRAAAREVTLGSMPALVHPHICKTYDTRSAVMTNALFDELEAHRERQQQRLERHCRLLRNQHQQQHPLSGEAAAQVSNGDGGGGGGGVDGSLSQSGGDGRHRSTSTRRTSTERRRFPKVMNTDGKRVLQFYMEQAATRFHKKPDRLQPLESNAPLAVLHEVLCRLGAVVGQTVTLVVMELCSKGTLSRAIHRGIFEPCDMWSMRVALRALVRTTAEIARALMHLHKSGVVHGDLKPGNVLLKSYRGDRRGFLAKIGDFGLSHLLPEGEKSLDTNTWGTPAYMAPEALLGHASTASDVWSFGIMLSEALTRQLPYGGSMEPARLVIGILDGSLELTWPAIYTDGISGGAAHPANCATLDTGVPMGTAAGLARQYGLVFPSTTLQNATATTATATNADVIGGGGGGGGGSLLGTSSSIEYGVNTGTTGTAANSIATTMLLTNMTGTDGSGCGDGGGKGGSVKGGSGSGDGICAASGAAPPDDDLERIFACLVKLGRRCTSCKPADRPCCSEILGELIDLEIVLKTPRSHRTVAGREALQDVIQSGVAARSRSRLGMTATTATTTTTKKKATKAPAAATPVAGVAISHPVESGFGYTRARGGEARTTVAGRGLRPEVKDTGLRFVESGFVEREVVRSNRPMAASTTAAATTDAAAAAGPAVQAKSRQRNMLEDFLDLMMSYQVACKAAQRAYGTKSMAAVGISRHPAAIVDTELGSPPLLPAAAVAMAVAAAPTDDATLPSLNLDGVGPLVAVVAAAAVKQEQAHEQKQQEGPGRVMTLLPEREPSLAIDYPLEPQEQQPPSFPPGTRPSSSAVQLQPLPLLLPLLVVPPPLLEPVLLTRAVGAAVAEGAEENSRDSIELLVGERPVGHRSCRVTGGITTGQAPSTPEVSEGCCFVSKASLEPS